MKWLKVLIVHSQHNFSICAEYNSCGVTPLIPREEIIIIIKGTPALAIGPTNLGRQARHSGRK